jgi:CRP-like cAMP-binding protein
MLMYVILDGYITTSVGDKIVGRSGPGAVIGEIALVDQKPRTASVTAETSCSLLAINRQTLLELVQNLPAFGIALLRILASRLCLGHTACHDPDKDPDDWDW